MQRIHTATIGRLGATRRRICVVVTALLAVGATVAEAGLRDNKRKNAIAASFTPPAHWSPYFHDDKGRSYPVQEPAELNSDKDWMFLRFTDYSGPKIRLAVMPVENQVAAGQSAVATPQGTVFVSGGGAVVPVGAVEELLTTALYEAHRFELVERKALQAVLAEQDLGADGRVTGQSSARLGSMLGSQYLVLGSINDWTPDKTKSGGGGLAAGRKALGAVGLNRSKAEVAMSFRSADTTTGQMLFATTERATAGSWGVSLGGLGLGGGKLLGGLGGFQKNSPISYAVRACINKGVYKLAAWLGSKAWSGSVIKVDGGRVYINAGANQGLAEGMTLTALTSGEELIDPETGLNLGSETAVSGTLRLSKVSDRFSVASVVAGCERLSGGDRVQLAD